MENDAGFTTPTFIVKDWKDLVSPQELEEYLELEELTKQLYQRAQNEKLADLTLKEYAEAIQKAKNEQKKIIYKYDFRRFVDELFTRNENEDDGSLL